MDPTSVFIDTLLDERELERIERRFIGGFRICSHLDCYDLAVAGIAGLVAALVDFLIVKIPTDVVYLGESLQEGSPLTKWLKSFEVQSDNLLSRWFKVSFDRVSSIDGLGPRDHRLHSLGHDPFIGLVIGTIDIMRGGLTEISKKGELLLQNDLGATSYNPLIAWFTRLDTWYRMALQRWDCRLRVGHSPSCSNSVPSEKRNGAWGSSPDGCI